MKVSVVLVLSCIGCTIGEIGAPLKSRNTLETLSTHHFASDKLSMDVSASDSTEELSGDGREEVRRMPQGDGNWKPWEGARPEPERQEMTSSASGSKKIPTMQKLEALVACMAAVIVAISANLFARYAIHELQEWSG